jgi:hypothetical protein
LRVVANPCLFRLIAAEVRGLLLFGTIRLKLIVTPDVKRTILLMRALNEEEEASHHVEDPVKHKKEKIARIGSRKINRRYQLVRRG